MQDDVAVILIMMAIEGALFVALGVPLMLGKVKPNRWYGFRTPATLENPDVWYPVNAYSGKWLVGVGLAMILASVLLYAWPELTEGQAVVTMVSVIMGGATTKCPGACRAPTVPGDSPPRPGFSMRGISSTLNWFRNQ